jgi:hypothetical protein
MKMGKNYLTTSKQVYMINVNLLESKIKPGSRAAVAFTKPLPMSNGVAGD